MKNIAKLVAVFLLFSSFLFILGCSEKEDVKTLRQRLDDERPYIRWRAARALGQIKDIHAIRALITVLKDRNLNVRIKAAEELLKIGKPAAAPLIAALKGENPYVREFAAYTLGEIRDRRAVEPLIVTLNDKNINVREAGTRALGQIRDPRAIMPLIAELSDKDINIRKYATEALARIRTPAIDPLILVLNDKNSYTRAEAAVALGLIKDSRAVGPLNTALKDKDRKVRNAAAQALERINRPSPMEKFVSAMRMTNSFFGKLTSWTKK
ncbi:MAG: HEAT repeat domain-containing protein [Candidatus Aminicenantes bacterium]|nr:MAG: HEAT repeat domain-containing protein [Candidatus Aminicenantes bacterium]